jgi:hypothetical protein
LIPRVLPHTIVTGLASGPPVPDVGAGGMGTPGRWADCEPGLGEEDLGRGPETGDWGLEPGASALFLPSAS